MSPPLRLPLRHATLVAVSIAAAACAGTAALAPAPAPPPAPAPVPVVIHEPPADPPWRPYVPERCREPRAGEEAPSPAGCRPRPGSL
jgi:hypothetical protein